VSGPRQARLRRCPSATEAELLRFAGAAALRLDPTFDPPGTEVSRQQASEPYSFEETRRRLGTGERGFEVLSRSDLIDGPATRTASTTEVSAYGLPGGCALRLRHQDWELTLDVDGEDAAVEAVLDGFASEFERPLNAAQLESLGHRALGALRGQDWARAIDDARAVVRQRPDDAAALLALGIALGASGDLAGAQRAMVATLERQPREHDAWYNLGNVHRTREEHLRAAACYRTVIAIDADNHPAHYQLGGVLEAAGRRDEAKDAYREAVRTSPNPGGASAYSGMDFTKAAGEAIARLGHRAARPRKKRRD